jgi:hypothetical protein
LCVFQVGGWEGEFYTNSTNHHEFLTQRRKDAERANTNSFQQKVTKQTKRIPISVNSSNSRKTSFLKSKISNLKFHNFP